MPQNEIDIIHQSQTSMLMLFRAESTIPPIIFICRFIVLF